MKTFFLLGAILAASAAFSQPTSAYEKHWYVKDGDTLPYRLLLPKNYDPQKKYPMILFLHGAGERGNDNEMQLVHGSSLFLRDSIRDNYPAIVVFPQCARNSFWSNMLVKTDPVTNKRAIEFQESGPPTAAMKLLLKFMDDFTDRYKVDKQRVYVGGLSMGGMGTFELVRRKPKYFAAAFPICGGAHPATAKKIRKPKWWIFHGLKDDVVNPLFSSQMAAALKVAGAAVKLTMYPDANHNSWDPAFSEKDLIPWLFSHRR